MSESPIEEQMEYFSHFRDLDKSIYLDKPGFTLRIMPSRYGAGFFELVIPAITKKDKDIILATMPVEHRALAKFFIAANKEMDLLLQCYRVVQAYKKEKSE